MRKPRRVYLRIWSRRRRRERKSKGLCVSCGGPTSLGTRCETCRTRHNEDSREGYIKNKEKTQTRIAHRYSKLKEKRLCASCGKPAFPGIYCEKHRMEQKARNRMYYAVRSKETLKQQYLERKARGLCVVCSEPVLWGCRCEKHREDFNRKRRLRSDMYKKSGRCARCGRVLDIEIDGDNVTCNICIEEAVFRNRVNGGVAL